MHGVGLTDDDADESSESNNSDGESELHSGIEEGNIQRVSERVRRCRARSMSFRALVHGVFNLLPHTPKTEMILV